MLLTTAMATARRIFAPSEFRMARALKAARHTLERSYPAMRLLSTNRTLGRSIGGVQLTV